ncbi:hypothetical protein FUT79_12000 [Treponema phagedenis]|nr:hypothetical protein FUT79_12000 [Treponema phagedenis]
MEPPPSVAVLSFCRPWQKLTLRVLKLCKYFCFKTSFLFGTTARHNFAVHGKIIPASFKST